MSTEQRRVIERYLAEVNIPGIEAVKEDFEPTSEPFTEEDVNELDIATLQIESRHVAQLTGFSTADLGRVDHLASACECIYHLIFADYSHLIPMDRAIVSLLVSQLQKLPNLIVTIVDEIEPALCSTVVEQVAIDGLGANAEKEALSISSYYSSGRLCLGISRLKITASRRGTRIRKFLPYLNGTHTNSLLEKVVISSAPSSLLFDCDVDGSVSVKKVQFPGMQFHLAVICASVPRTIFPDVEAVCSLAGIEALFLECEPNSLELEGERNSLDGLNVVGLKSQKPVLRREGYVGPAADVETIGETSGAEFLMKQVTRVFSRDDGTNPDLEIVIST